MDYVLTVHICNKMFSRATEVEELQSACYVFNFSMENIHDKQSSVK